jgi:hypothetical protein
MIKTSLTFHQARAFPSRHGYMQMASMKNDFEGEAGVVGWVSGTWKVLFHALSKL